MVTRGAEAVDIAVVVHILQDVQERKLNMLLGVVLRLDRKIGIITRKNTPPDLPRQMLHHRLNL